MHKSCASSPFGKFILGIRERENHIRRVSHHSLEYIHTVTDANPQNQHARINITIRTMPPWRPAQSNIICITGNPVLDSMVASKSCMQNRNPMINIHPMTALTAMKILSEIQRINRNNCHVHLPAIAITKPTGPAISAFFVSSDMCAEES